MVLYLRIQIILVGSHLIKLNNFGSCESKKIAHHWLKRLNGRCGISSVLMLFCDIARCTRQPYACITERALKTRSNFISLHQHFLSCFRPSHPSYRGAVRVEMCRD